MMEPTFPTLLWLVHLRMNFWFSKFIHISNILVAWGDGQGFRVHGMSSSCMEPLSPWKTPQVSFFWIGPFGARIEGRGNLADYRCTPNSSPWVQFFLIRKENLKGKSRAVFPCSLPTPAVGASGLETRASTYFCQDHLVIWANVWAYSGLGAYT